MSSAESIVAALRAGQLAHARTLALAALASPEVDRGQLHALIGKLSIQLGDTDQARAHLEAAVDRGVDDPAAWVMLAGLVERAARRKQLLSRAAHHPRGSGEAAAQLATDAEEAGQIDEAVRWWQRAAQDLRRAPEALARIAVLSAQRAKWQDGLESLQKILDLHGDPGPLADAVRALLAAPVADLSLDTALDRLEQQGLPAADAAQWRALRHVALRQPDVAVHHARLAVEAAPQDPEARRLLGECLLLDGQTEAGADVLEPLAADGLLADHAALALADALRRLGRVEAALPVVERTAQAAPGHAGVLIELSRIYADLGREAEAEAAIRQAMALDARVDQEAGRSSQVLRGVLAELPGLLQRLEAGSGWQVVRLRMGHNALLCQLEQANGATLYAKACLPGRRSEAHVEATARLEEALAADARLAARLAVPAPLRDGQGRRAHPCAGGVAAVSRAIDGVSLRRTLAQPRQGLAPGQAGELGRSLAQLHDAFLRVHNTADDGRPWRRPPAGLTSAVLPLLQWLDDARAWPAARARLGLYGEGEALGDALQAHLERWLPALAEAVDGLEMGVIHGDFGWHNATWVGQGEGLAVAGLVDFDYAAWDVPLADLAQAVGRTAADWKRLTHHRDPAPRPELAKALIEGYFASGAPRPVGAEGLRALLAGTRIAYGFALAEAGLQRDVRAPNGYGPALDALALLQMQLDWLEDGAAVLIPG